VNVSFADCDEKFFGGVFPLLESMKHEIIELSKSLCNLLLLDEDEVNFYTEIHFSHLESPNIPEVLGY
jgi:hypothetical protein